MNREQVLKMIDAGFTKEEIAKFFEDEPTPNPTPAPEPTPTPSPEPEQKDVLAMLTKINETLTAQSQLFQNMNTLNSTQPKQQDFSDILATIINPTGGVNNGK